MSRNVPRPSFARAVVALWCAMASVLALAVLPSSASAAVITMNATDPTDASPAGLDLTSAAVVYDSTVGAVSITAITAAPNEGFVPMGLIAVLTQAQGGKCDPEAPTGPVLVFSLSWTGEGDLTKWLLTTSTNVHDAPSTRKGATLASTTGPDSRLRNRGWNCAQIQTKTEAVDPATGSTDAVDVDAMDLFAAAAPAPTTQTPTSPASTGTSGSTGSTGSSGSSSSVPPPVFTTEPDEDKDGVPDTLDACPTVTGAATNGCLTIPSRLAVRLGRKRVAIDKMVKRTAKNVCPTKAKVKVTRKVGKKTKSLGRGTIKVSTHGSYCHAYGVVRLKKTVRKRQKVKISVKAKGMGSIGAKRKR